MRGDVFHVQLAVRAEQLAGEDVEWDEFAAHLASMLTEGTTLMNGTPTRRFKVEATIDTAEEVEA